MANMQWKGFAALISSLLITLGLVKPMPTPTLLPIVIPSNTPVIATIIPTPTISDLGSIRIYVQWDGDQPHPASVQGECDYANANRKVPPCRGGLGGYSVKIYSVSTGQVIQSPKTNSKGWTTAYLPPGKYYHHTAIEKGAPYLPETNVYRFTIQSGKQVANYGMVDMTR